MPGPQVELSFQSCIYRIPRTTLASLFSLLPSTGLSPAASRRERLVKGARLLLDPALRLVALQSACPIRSSYPPHASAHPGSAARGPPCYSAMRRPPAPLPRALCQCAQARSSPVSAAHAASCSPCNPVSAAGPSAQGLPGPSGPAGHNGAPGVVGPPGASRRGVCEWARGWSGASAGAH